METSSVVIIGGEFDATISHFTAFLRDERVDHQMIPLEQVIGRATMSLSAEDARLELPGRTIVLKSSQSRVYCRLILPPNPSDGELARWKILRAFLQRSTGTVINRPLAGLSNMSKALQQLAFQELGIRSPVSLLTNKECLVRTWRAGRDVIFKSASSIRSVVTKLDSRADDRFYALKNCPVLFQDFVSGFDVRVHVIDSHCYAEEIHSKSVDYRYAPSGQITFRPIILPKKVEHDCIVVTNSMGLCFSGIDFKVDTAGRYWMLEVNPMPAYEGYDRRLDRAISKALLRSLERMSGETGSGGSMPTRW